MTACAGEPVIVSIRFRNGVVYPRACGGTFKGALESAKTCGLSPRVRGNPVVRVHYRPPSDTVGRTFFKRVQLVVTPAKIDWAPRRNSQTATERAQKNTSKPKPPSDPQRERKKQAKRDFRKSRKSSGLCLDCSNKARPGRTRCAFCSERQKWYDRARRARGTQS